MLRFLLAFSFCLLAVSSLTAEERLQIVVEGLEGDVMENVEAALVPPPAWFAKARSKPVAETL